MSDNGDSLISLRDVGKTFCTPGVAPLPILSGVDLDITIGEAVVVMGSSGSGKTTLLNLMAGLDRVSSGTVMWKGSDMGVWSGGKRARWRNRQCGFVFQTAHLFPEFNVLENVLMPCWIGGREQVGRAEALIQRVGLAERMKHRPAELSGGEQQRVVLARALINDPEIVFADEPTGNLDARNAAEVMDLLLALLEESKKSLVLVTHDREVAGRVSRRMLLQHGKLVSIED